MPCSALDRRPISSSTRFWDKFYQPFNNVESGDGFISRNPNKPEAAVAIVPSRSSGLVGITRTRIVDDYVDRPIHNLALTELIDEHFNRLYGHLGKLVEEIAKMISQSTAEQAKEYYTVAEFAELVDRKPYTVRKWCHDGRIEGRKAGFGRGDYKEWRVSHRELTRYRSEGLLARKPHSKIPPPESLG